jgi:hypothetical protein
MPPVKAGGRDRTSGTAASRRKSLTGSQLDFGPFLPEVVSLELSAVIRSLVAGGKAPAGPVDAGRRDPVSVPDSTVVGLPLAALGALRMEEACRYALDIIRQWKLQILCLVAQRPLRVVNRVDV